jgi:hypothetical protein
LIDTCGDTAGKSILVKVTRPYDFGLALHGLDPKTGLIWHFPANRLLFELNGWFD